MQKIQRPLARLGQVELSILHTKEYETRNDGEIKLLLEEKHCLHKAHPDDTSSESKNVAYNNICKPVQNRLCDIQDSWLSKKAEEIFCRPKGYEEVP